MCFPFFNVPFLPLAISWRMVYRSHTFVFCFVFLNVLCLYVLLNVPPEHKDQHQVVPGVLSSVNGPRGARWRKDGEGGGVYQDNAGAHYRRESLSIIAGERFSFCLVDKVACLSVCSLPGPHKGTRTALWPQLLRWNLRIWWFHRDVWGEGKQPQTYGGVPHAR